MKRFFTADDAAMDAVHMEVGPPERDLGMELELGLP